MDRVNPRRASGPDKLRDVVLRNCAMELIVILTKLILLVQIWKESTLIPKKTNKAMNDYRPET